MRLIDADKLMSDIEHYHLSDGKFQHWVEIQNTIDPEPHWIPNTKETVPKDPLRKQIQLKNGWIITGWFDEEHWNWYPVPGFDEPFKFEDVVAWCELPSPYQPEE